MFIITYLYNFKGNLINQNYSDYYNYVIYYYKAYIECII